MTRDRFCSFLESQPAILAGAAEPPDSRGCFR
jgi:hypothetical protein